jgi:hypothetical protein
METKRVGLTDRQQAALAELLVQPVVKKVAEKLEIPYPTLRYWLDKDPLFKREYRKARAAIFDQMIAKLERASSLAINVLIKELKNKRSTVRLKAVSIITNLLFRGIEYQALQQIEELRERIEGTDASESEGPTETPPSEGSSQSP